jgi:hypothetical protein
VGFFATVNRSTGDEIRLYLEGKTLCFLLKQIPADLALDGPYRLIIDRYIVDTRLRLRQVLDEQDKLLQWSPL